MYETPVYFETPFRISCIIVNKRPVMITVHFFSKAAIKIIDKIGINITLWITLSMAIIKCSKHQRNQHINHILYSA